MMSPLGGQPARPTRMPVSASGRCFWPQRPIGRRTFPRRSPGEQPPPRRCARLRPPWRTRWASGPTGSQSPPHSPATSARRRCTSATAIAPSPIAAAPQLIERIAAIAKQGITEIVYQPTGPHITREPEAFIRPYGSARRGRRVAIPTGGLSAAPGRVVPIGRPGTRLALHLALRGHGSRARSAHQGPDRRPCPLPTPVGSRVWPGETSMVGGAGIEPTTSSMSSWRSPD